MSDAPFLYLIIPGDGEIAAEAEALAARLDRGGVACVLLAATPAAESRAHQRRAEALMPIAHARDVAFLVEGDAALADAIGADGVHLPSPADYAAARKLLGEDRIVGCAVGLSRHEAMEIGDAGADYVALGAADAPPDADLVQWWAELFTVPQVAFGTDDPVIRAALREAGADFVTERLDPAL